MKKKIFLIILCGVCLCFVTGCGSQKLVCTGGSNGMEEKVSITFQSDKAKEMTLTMYNDASSYTQNQIDKQLKSIKKSYSSYEKKGLHVDVGQQKKKKVYISISGTIKQFKDANLDGYVDLDKITSSYDDAKEYLLSQEGTSCE